MSGATAQGRKVAADGGHTELPGRAASQPGATGRPDATESAADGSGRAEAMDPAFEAGSGLQAMEDAVEAAREVRARLPGLRAEFVDFVRQLAEEESPSTDPDAQRGVRHILTSALTELGLEVEHVPGERSGGHLVACAPGVGASSGRFVARPPGVGADRGRGGDSSLAAGPRLRQPLDAGKPFNPDGPPSRSDQSPHTDPPSGVAGRPLQLLVGHMDTVWPVGTLREMPVRFDGERLCGPGVFDMKAGLAIGIFALRCLRDAAIETAVAPVFLINSDEEVGSPESQPLIERWARRVRRAFVMEPALGADGRLKTRRKGIGHYSVRVMGRSSHAGLAPEDGASAIHQLARSIRDIEALAAPGEGTTVNVGIIRGGSRPNVVAAEASGEVDVRVWSAAEAERVRAGMFGLEATVPGTSISVTEVAARGPLERTPRNAALWGQAQRVAAGIGLELKDGSAGGGSDGNLTSLHTATLDGLGAVGDGAHALTEYIQVDRTLERVALLAGLLAAP